MENIYPKKILIIKLGAIGDLLMATPAFVLLRKTYPGAEIVLLVGRWSAEIVKNNPSLNRLIVIDEKIFWQYRVKELYRLYLKLKRERFDTVFLMHWSKYFNLFVYLLRIPIRIGFNRLQEGWTLTKKVPYTEGYKGLHTVDRYLLQVTESYVPTDRQMQIYLTEDDYQSTETLKQEITTSTELKQQLINPSFTYIVMAPGGGVNPKQEMLSRRWPVANFGLLINRIITELGYPIVLLGGKTERNLTAPLFAVVGTNQFKCINLIGRTTLRQSAVLLKESKFFIGNDSGLLHLAAAVGTPTLSIFGPTAPYDKVPLGDRHGFIYREKECSPCYRYGKFKKCTHLTCLTAISVQEVYQKFLTNLKKIK